MKTMYKVTTILHGKVKIEEYQIIQETGSTYVIQTPDGSVRMSKESVVLHDTIEDGLETLIARHQVQQETLRNALLENGNIIYNLMSSLSDYAAERREVE